MVRLSFHMTFNKKIKYKLRRTHIVNRLHLDDTKLLQTMFFSIKLPPLDQIVGVVNAM